jgi:hypothetical protein
LVSLPALIFATLIGLGILPPIITETIYYIGISILFLGFIILSFSVYNFPPFYEFEWKENLINLFIINQKNLRSLYHYDFSKSIDKKEEDYQAISNKKDQLFSRGILGIEIISSIITGIGDEKINKIKKGDYYLYLDYGKSPSFITYVLVVKEDLISSHHLLKSIKYSFESFFKEILLNIDNLPGDLEKIFESFDCNMNRILQQQ